MNSIGQYVTPEVRDRQSDPKPNAGRAVRSMTDRGITILNFYLMRYESHINLINLKQY
jgi:hypothetical protein